MKLVPIKEYAIKNEVSIQTVYNRIKNNSIYMTEIDKKKYILECDIINKINNDNSEIETLKSENEVLKSELKNRNNLFCLMKSDSSYFKIISQFQNKIVINKMINNFIDKKY